MSNVVYLFITSGHTDAETIVKGLSLFYIEKALDQICPGVWGMLPGYQMGHSLSKPWLVTTVRKFSSRHSWIYTLSVKKYKTLSLAMGLHFRFQLDSCNDREHQVTLADHCVLKACFIYLEEEGKLMPAQTIFVTFKSPTMPEYVMVLCRRHNVRLYLLHPVCC
jgi:hypothetical protein